jgi:hypothetical protein
MIKTFSLEEFNTFVRDHPTVARILRLEQLNAANTSATEITKGFKRGNIQIGSSVAAAIAEIVIFFGLDHTSSRATLSRAVFEVVQGWALKADGTSQEKAKHFVGVFGTKMFADTGKMSMSFSEHMKLEQA